MRHVLKALLLSLIIVSQCCFASFGMKNIKTKLMPNINWNLTTSGEFFQIANSDLPVTLIEVSVNPFTNGRPSDVTYMACNVSKGAYVVMVPGVDYTCDLNYIDWMYVFSSSFANGSSGNYHLVNKADTPRLWNLATYNSTVNLLKNSSGRNLNVYYYVDYYVNNAGTKPSDRVTVSCTNKVFAVSHGNGQVCQVPVNGTASVQLSKSDFLNGSSGGFVVLGMD